MNIYVETFRKNDNAYIVTTQNYNYWWYETQPEEPDVRKYDSIKKGSLIKYVRQRANDTQVLGYLIATQDVEIPEINPSTVGSYLRLPVDTYNGYIIDLDKPGRGNDIWDSIIPGDRYATAAPWTFVTEGIITDYISFQWNDKYYEPGSFNLVVPASQDMMDLIKEGRYLLIGESDRAMIIEKIQFNNNLKSDGYIMQISGRSLESILERRVAFPGQGLNTNEYKGENGLCKAIYDLVDHFFIHPEEIAQQSSDGVKQFYYPERKVDFIALPSEGARYSNVYIKRPFRASVNKTVSKDDLLKIISDLCKNEQLGFKIVPKNRLDDTPNCIYWEFSLFTGSDKSYTRPDKSTPLLLFSPVLGNVEAVSTTKDITNYRNVIFCGKEKDSDSYINLMTATSEALDYKTGIEVVDKFNSGATTLITGAKNQLTTKLENSEIAYTGVLFIAVAAALKDKGYTATVTDIRESSADRTKLYMKLPQDDPTQDLYSNSENAMKLKVRIKKDTNIIDNIAAALNISGNYKDDYLSFILGGPIITYQGEKYREVFLLPSYGEKPDILGLYGEDQGSGNIHYFIDDGVPKLNVAYTSANDTDMGEISANGRHTGTLTLPLYDFVNEPIQWDEIPEGEVGPVPANQIQTVTFHLLYSDDVYTADDGTPLLSYPSGYISKERAKNIKITFRHAFGDQETSSSSKTGSFMLSDVSKVVSSDNPDALTFKMSTEFGWFTTTILKQATSDLNNTTFARLSSVKKSAIQAWFKTFDKYTSTNSQMRWLCQEYKYDSENDGINRREVFVEQVNSESDEWNASAINQFQSSTQVYSVDQEEDEESDEKTNEKLLDSARKKSGDYRKVRDVDASFELETYKYMGDNATGYDLGDIIQVDDGWENLDKFYITGVVISNDTTSGPKIVPSFERYEDIPKEYKKLDYLQVANMILPAKFNRHFSGEQDASELNLPPNTYFGATDSEEEEVLEKISSVSNEATGVITDIECDLQYIQKTSISGEEPQPLSPNFALISAIGSQYRKPNQTTNDQGIRMPFVVLSSNYKSPYFFMSKYSADQYYADSDNKRKIYMYMCNDVLHKSTASGKFNYRSGVGYKNKYIEVDKEIVDADSVVDADTISVYDLIYYADHEKESQNALKKCGLEINKIVIDGTVYTKVKYSGGVYDGVEELPNDKDIYYSKSKATIDGDSVEISKRPLVRAYYKKDIICQPSNDHIIWAYRGSLSPLDADACFIDRSTPIGMPDNQDNLLIVKETGSAALHDRRVNILDEAMNSSIKPSYDDETPEIMIDTSYWGIDNYRRTDYEDLLYENNIVIGGAGCYVFNSETEDYKLYFEKYDSVSTEINPIPLIECMPKACDVGNGVRIPKEGIRIYETVAASRSVTFNNYFHSNVDGVSKTMYVEAHDERYLYNQDSRIRFTTKADYLSAYYPDLSTRKLVHEYIPVVYSEAGNDVDNVEKYGLYDTIDKIFVPINWGNNEFATFVEAGGEIKNE